MIFQNLGKLFIAQAGLELLHNFIPELSGVSLDFDGLRWGKKELNTSAGNLTFRCFFNLLRVFDSHLFYVLNILLVQGVGGDAATLIKSSPGRVTVSEALQHLLQPLLVPFCCALCVCCHFCIANKSAEAIVHAVV